MFKSLFIFKKEKIKKCNFCNCIESRKNPLLAGRNSWICANCVLAAYQILFGALEHPPTIEALDNEDEDIDFLASIRKK